MNFAMTCEISWKKTNINSEKNSDVFIMCSERRWHTCSTSTFNFSPLRELTLFSVLFSETEGHKKNHGPFDKPETPTSERRKSFQNPLPCSFRFGVRLRFQPQFPLVSPISFDAGSFSLKSCYQVASAFLVPALGLSSESSESEWNN